jgi:hypothetical protein
LQPNKADRSGYLDREQQQIECGFWLFVVGLHRANDTGAEPIDPMVPVCLSHNGVIIC